MKKFFFLLLIPINLFAQLELPSIFSDHMVIQQQKPIQVWGKGQPGNTITVAFKEQTLSADVDDQGNWNLALAPETGSFEPAVLQVSNGTDTLQFQNILVGEVWLCSGQSNMNWPLNRAKNADLEVPLANYPALRLFKVKQMTSGRPEFTSEGQWVPCSSQTAANFSAAGYFFGRDLHTLLNVPVGLVQASWNGSPAIAWTRSSAFPNHPLLIERGREWEGYVDTYDAKLVAWEEDIKLWLKQKNLQIYVQDPGISEEAQNWHEVGLNDFNWDKISLPAIIEDELEDMDGAVWFRRRLELPVPMRGEELTLALGPIADYDQTWVNGVLIGQTGEESPRPTTVDRRYKIPARLTRTGEITIAIRVFDRGSTGGFLGEAKSMLIVGKSSAIRLAGEGWSYKVESRLETSMDQWQLQQYSDAPKRPPKPDSPHRPASLANGMLATIVPYSLRGVIWYQGETDTEWEPAQYGARARVMFDDWRKWWEDENIYIGVVQLANYMKSSDVPSDGPWPILRESQRTLVRDLPASGLVVTTDLGEANDIHPRNKQDVGRRLARLALVDVYKAPILRGSPELARVTFRDERIILQYTHVGEGLTILNSDVLGGFTVAGADGVFVNANASIEGNDAVVVTSDSISKPVAIRYAWQNNPVNASLGNKAGLPASPFQVAAPHTGK